MKRIDILFMAFILIAGVGSAAMVSVEAPIQAPVGQTFTVNVTALAMSNAYTSVFVLEFDPTVLQVAGVTKGSFLSGDGIPTNATYNTTYIPGKIFFVDTRGTTYYGINTSKTENIATITFNGLKNGSSNLILSDVLLGDILVQDEYGVLVKCNSTERSSCLDASIIIGEVIPGDITNDGMVNYNDLLMLAVAYGTSEGEPGYNPKADFSGNKEIDYNDLLLLAVNYGKGT